MKSLVRAVWMSELTVRPLGFSSGCELLLHPSSSSKDAERMPPWGQHPYREVRSGLLLAWRMQHSHPHLGPPV